jgi:hypothetical protein
MDTTPQKTKEAPKRLINKISSNEPEELIDLTSDFTVSDPSGTQQVKKGRFSLAAPKTPQKTPKPVIPTPIVQLSARSPKALSHVTSPSPPKRTKQMSPPAIQHPPVPQTVHEQVSLRTPTTSTSTTSTATTVTATAQGINASSVESTPAKLSTFVSLAKGPPQIRHSEVVVAKTDLLKKHCERFLVMDVSYERFQGSGHLWGAQNVSKPSREQLKVPFEFYLFVNFF